MSTIIDPGCSRERERVVADAVADPALVAVLDRFGLDGSCAPAVARLLTALAISGDASGQRSQTGSRASDAGEGVGPIDRDREGEGEMRAPTVLGEVVPGMGAAVLQAGADRALAGLGCVGSVADWRSQ